MVSDMPVLYLTDFHRIKNSGMQIVYLVMYSNNRWFLNRSVRMIL